MLPTSMSSSGAYRICPKLLAERLRRLLRVGVVERRAPKGGKWSEYRLTAAGRELQRVIDVWENGARVGLLAIRGRTIYLSTGRLPGGRGGRRPKAA